MSDYELYHHGIKGMRWGVRRFQRKDGSLTILGRKRYADDSDGDKINKPKTVKDMSDQELRDRVNRMSLEVQAINLERQISSLSPKKVTLGQKFANSTLGKIVTPALVDSGKKVLTDYLTKTGSKMLGLDKDDSDKYLNSLKGLDDTEAARLSKRAENLSKINKNRRLIDL